MRALRDQRRHICTDVRLVMGHAEPDDTKRVRWRVVECRPEPQLSRRSRDDDGRLRWIVVALHERDIAESNSRAVLRCAERIRVEIQAGILGAVVVGCAAEFAQARSQRVPVPTMPLREVDC